MKISTHVAFGTLVLFAIPVFASAETLAFDTGLADGTYYGHGNSNAGWTSLTDTAEPNGTLELGLGGIIRYVGPAPETGSNYYVPTGATTVPGKTGSAWGFDFSVDTNVGGTGTATLANYTYNLLITDLTTAATSSFDPSLIGDNSHLGNYGFQNSEALSFGFLVPYDINAADTYEFTLSATPVGAGTADSVTIDVNAQTPEPATFGMIGFGLLGVVAAARRKRSA